MQEEITRDLDVRSSSVALWFSALAGPLSFLIDLQVRYGLVTYACRNGVEWIFWAAAISALIVTAIAGVIGWRYWPSDDRRIHFMAIAGFAISVMSAIAIIALAIPNLFLHACD